MSVAHRRVRYGMPRLTVAVAMCCSALAQPPVVGPVGPGETIVTSGQLVHPAGRTVEIPARPVDLVRSADGRFVFVKESKGVTVLDAARWEVHRRLSLGDDPASMTGIALSPTGTLYITDATTGLRELQVSDDGSLSAARTIRLPAASGPEDNSFPCGIAISRDGSTAFVCLSRNNTLGVVDLKSGTLTAEVPIGVAPFAVLLDSDQSLAYVSVWGGRRPGDGEHSANTSGTKALVDERGIAASGGVSVVDLASRKEVAYIDTGLSASALALTRDGSTLFVANSNGDTVSVVDVGARKVVRQIVVKPDPGLPFGSMPSALALSSDERALYVACAGNNALAVVTLGPQPEITGWIPTGWYPGAILADQSDLIIANIKGIGSRTARKDGSFNSLRHRGSLQRLPIPDAAALAAMTQEVRREALVPQVLHEQELSAKRRATPAAPIPERPGEPSVFEHVVYIIKENRTYDQIFGDLAAGDKPRGNGKPELCIYGREITPNHHALAERFVLLDNYYCNGVLSADGHSWATEGNSTPYLERSFGGFKRTYTYGDDPLTYSSSGFVWDHVLAAGFSFRNFGELAFAHVMPPGGQSKKWPDVYADWKSGAKAYRFTGTTGIDKLRRYTDPEAPGWNLEIPDQIRADHFIAELHKYEAAGSMPSFIIMHLPNDHTDGVSEGHPTPRAYIADNDLALGRVVEAVSHSRFWSTTCMFVNEDDPQDGWDHVDGHRSLCLVISPYARRGQVVSEFYNQASVVHSIERIFGLTAANQAYAAAPVMTACFGQTADTEAYQALPSSVALDEITPAQPKRRSAPGEGGAPPSQKGGGVSAVSLMDLYALTAKQDFSKPDLINEAEFNLVLWHAAKGPETPYPAQFAGAHGKGLGELGLTLDAGPRQERGADDDDDK
jgi:YVTN family beta-propeller protein